ncbi:MAG: hypothetical protein CBE00_01995 [Planctomycetaceae bacterium TMED240]|nr:hypothetical protein [Rhodopirellula sp.]OUX08298.1 MAG: hypothetical protein CBE00_01995 [Planctomycetaceae bacterium TMED240]
MLGNQTSAKNLWIQVQPVAIKSERNAIGVRIRTRQIEVPSLTGKLQETFVYAAINWSSPAV